MKRIILFYALVCTVWSISAQSHKDIASVDIAQAMIDEFKEKEPLVWKVVFKDNGFASDDVKANTRETLKMAGLQDGSFITL